jgi:hypothetical protein
MNYFQTSALTGEGIPELVSGMLRMTPKATAKADLLVKEAKSGGIPLRTDRLTQSGD